MKELNLEKLIDYIVISIDNIEGKDYNKERLSCIEQYQEYVTYIEQYQEYVTYTISQSELKDILKLKTFNYWDDEILENISLDDAPYFKTYINELKEYFTYTDIDYMDVEDIEVINNFYTSKKRKEILNKLLESIKTFN